MNLYILEVTCQLKAYRHNIKACPQIIQNFTIENWLMLPLHLEKMMDIYNFGGYNLNYIKPEINHYNIIFILFIVSSI